jgi:predicted TIM-barrel fold metal-dependent hydrolase
MAAIVDAHAHIGSWPSVRKSEGMVLSSMDKYGIAFSIVSDCDCSEFDDDPSHPDHHVTAYQGLKMTLRFVRAHPGRLGAAVWIEPHRERLSPELVDLISKNRGLIYAVKFHPYESRMRVNDKRLIPYLEMARSFGLPVIVHTAADRWSDIRYLSEVAKKYPDLNFVAAHMQLCSDNKAGLKALRDNPNIYGDTAWVKMEVARKALVSIGGDKVMFGTDNPIDGPDTYSNPMYQEYFDNAEGLPKRLYRKLMAGNAIKLFKLPLRP